jgi:hypothetical protein
MSKKLTEQPTIHPTAVVSESTLGRYTEVGERCRIDEVEFGDYSYIERDGSIWCATIGKLAHQCHQPSYMAGDAASLHLSCLQLLAGRGCRSGFLCLAP